MKIKNTKRAIQFSLLAIALVILGSTYMVLSDVASLGNAIGETTGRIVGTFTGSYNGFIKGREAGKNAGLNADDTNVEVGSIQEIGELEVLEVNFTEYTSEAIGGDQDNEKIKAIDPDYALLYSMKGRAVYTVNLQLAKVEKSKENEDWIVIKLPEINVTPRIDSSSFDEIDHYIKGKNSGTTIDGLIAYENSKKVLEKKIKSAFEENGSLKRCAIESAKTQVKALGEALIGKTVSEVFVEGEKENE